MSDEAIIIRVEKLERTAVTCLCILPCFFAMQCLLAATACLDFDETFIEFGAKLPALTQFAIRTWGFWAMFAVAVPIAAFAISRKSKASISLTFSTVSGIVMFLVAQILTAALFLPLFQMSAVIGGGK